ncbi:MAG TPA: serine hydrolase domain-containing protein [Chryseosolibacter sp.]|nr:serine hydrolase domain-containing protein [Chryseosolibacter sp.]
MLRTNTPPAALLIAALCFNGCSPVKEQAPKQFDDLDRYLTSELSQAEPGGAVLIMKADSIIYSKGFGVADVVTKEPVTPKTLFNLGSISKTFVANAILKLQEEGRLSVEDSLIKYFPGFANRALVQGIQLKHLLTHTSGLPDNRNVRADTVFYLTAKDEENWAPVMNAESLNFQPGTNYEYSNPAFNALALIVERVSGMKWQSYIEKNIFRPAGMSTSTITDGPHPESGVAHAYVRIGEEWKEDDYGEEPTFAASGNGGVWSSVEELAMYEIALQKAVFLKAETVADSRTVKQFDNWSATKPPFIGWSWFIRERDGLRVVGHTGDQGGFLCNYVTVPEKDVFFVILCNTRRNVDGITDVLFKKLSEANWLE